MFNLILLSQIENENEIPENEYVDMACFLLGAC